MNGEWKIQILNEAPITEIERDFLTPRTQY